MAAPIVIAKNQTGSDIDLTRLGLRVPASGQRTLTDFSSYTECTEDDSLEAFVTAGDIVINDGTSDLSTAEALVYLNSSGNLNGPATGIAANVLLKLADTTGTRTVATGITVDGSDNLTTTGTVNAATLQVSGQAISHSTLLASSLAWTASGHTGTASRIPSFNGAGVAAEVQVGVDLQAWDTDLDALAGLATTGIIVRSGSGTAVTRSLVQPAAGITVSNGSGVAGDPTLALANDLLALEGLGSTGFAVRTGSDTWAQRSLTAPAAGFTITNPAGIAANPTFALADDLAALEAMAGTGVVVRTAANTYAQRTLTQPAAGITITNPAGLAGNPTFVLANDLAALEGLGSTGIAVRTGADTWAQRTITGTSNVITVTNGSGVAGNPTLTVGSNVPNIAGTQGDVIYHNGTNWVALPAGTSGYILTTNGVGANPVWSNPSAAVSHYWSNSFTSSSGQPYIEVTSTSYTTVATSVWPGTDNVESVSRLLAAVELGGGTSMSIRIFDVTNTAVIAELTGITDTPFAVRDMGTVSNLSATPAVWEVQILGAGGGRKARAASVAGEFSG